MNVRSAILLISAIAGLAYLRNYPLQNLLIQQTVDRISLPFRMLELQRKPADMELIMPVDGIRVNRVANTWFAPRPGGRKHHGQDIFGARGTPVYSATGGIVIRKNETGLGGNSVSVLGGGGRVYYYAHLDRFAEDLAVGDEVDVTSLLGYLGNTGNARTTSPHLHFGMYTPTGPLDPLPLLIRRKPAPEQPGFVAGD